MANNNETTMRFNADISGLKKGLADANRQIRLANAQFSAASSAMDDWSSSADGLTAKISQLEAVQDAENRKLQLLQQQYDLTAAAMGENSTEAQELEIQINQQQTRINRVTSELENYRSQLDQVRNSTDDAGDAAQNNISSYDRLSDTIADQEAELQRLQDQYKNYVIEGQGASDEARELATRISNLSDDLNDNRTALNNADTAAENLAGSMDDADDSTETLSDGFTVLKGAISDMVADGIRWCIDNLKELVTESDKAFNSFQAQTGVGADAMADFETQISNLYKANYGDSMQDVADAMAQVAQTSKETDPSKIQELTKNAIVLRDTFGFEINESMRAVNMLMDQFGMTGEEAFNLIAQGAQNGLNKNDDLLDSINEYSVHYKQLGYSGEEFFNSLANGTAAGTFSVDKLGDAMKEFGIRVKDGSDSTAEAFTALGLGVGSAGLTFDELETSIAEAEKRTQTYSDKIADVEQKLKYAQMEQANFNDKTSELTKMKSADKIAGLTSELEKLKSSLEFENNNISLMKSMQDEALTAQQEVGDLGAQFAEGGETAKAATQKVIDALFSMDDKVQQDAAGVALFGTMWEDLGADGVKALMDVNGEADKTAATLSEIDSIKYDDIGSVFSEIGRIIKVDLLQPIADALMPTITEFIDWLKSDAIPWLIDHGNEIIGVVTGIATAFLAFKAVTIIQGIITAFTALIGIIKAVGVQQALLNVIMAANPIGIVVAAIAGLVAAFIYFWNTSDEFREFWITLWDNIVETVKKMIGYVVEFWTGVWDGIKETASAAGEVIKDIWTAISDFFAGIWNAISSAASAAWEAIKEFFAPAVEWFKSLFESVWNFYKSYIDLVIGLAEGCWNIIKRVFEVVSDWFNKNVITPVANFFKAMWDKISTAAKTTWDGIKTVFSVVGEWFKSKVIDPVANFFGGMWDKLKTGASAAWDGITSVFGSVVDWFREKFSAAWEAVKNVFSTGGKIFDGIKDGIVSAFKTVVNAIIRGINKVISFPFEKINEMLNKISDISILDIKPFAGLWGHNPLAIPQIPELAKGGVLKRGQVGLLEGDGAEAVVPLEKNTQWIKRVAAEMSQQLNGGGSAVNSSTNSTVNNYTFNQTNNSPKALNRLEIYRQSKQQTAFIKAVTGGV